MVEALVEELQDGIVESSEKHLCGVLCPFGTDNRRCQGRCKKKLRDSAFSHHGLHLCSECEMQWE